jgi:preprotein translocase subunit SecD
MTRRSLFALFFLATGLTPMATFAGGKIDDKTVVSFHVETDTNENPKMIFQLPVEGQTRYFRRLPEVSTRDMKTFRPFPSDAGGYGVVFELKNNAAQRLGAITSANPERWLAAMVNGRGVDAVFIDKPINDGKVVVWKGFTATEIQQLDKLMPRTGETKKRG